MSKVVIGPSAPASALPTGQGAIVVPLVVPTLTSDVPRPRDTLENKTRAPLESRSQAAAPRAVNVFASLARGACEPPRELARERVSLATVIDTPPTVFAGLVGVEQGVGADARTAFQKIRTGLLLLGYDAPASPPALTSVAAKVMQNNVEGAKSDFAAFLKKFEHGLGKTHEDVNLMVQRVLREAYLLGTESLRDYAEKVQRFNDQKKKTRELLEDARKTQGAWSREKAVSGQGDAFLASEPFECKSVDPLTGEVQVERMSAADVRAEAATAEAKTSSGEGYDSFFGPSRLSYADKTLLAKIKDNDDDFLKDHLDEAKRLLGKMNSEEFTKWFPKLIDKLMGGNTDEDEIIELYESLGPYQIASLYSGGMDPRELEPELIAGLGAAVANLERGSIAGGPLDGSQDAVLLGLSILDPFSRMLTEFTARAGAFIFGLFDGLDDGDKAEIDLIMTRGIETLAAGLGMPLEGKPDPETAAALLAVARAKYHPPSRAAQNDEGQVVAGPKLVRSPAALEAHIKALEEQLNSLGDDAQLANVDLQNELQKQQQLLQMMSNISKMLFETAIQIVRKIGT